MLTLTNWILLDYTVCQLPKSLQMFILFLFQNTTSIKMHPTVASKKQAYLVQNNTWSW